MQPANGSDFTLEEMQADGTTRSILAGYLADPDKYLEADGYAD